MDEQQKQYLQALADKHGRLTPDTVVEDARSKDSPLHTLFEWNLKAAAHAHWVERARELIRCIKVTVTTSTPATVRVVPMFVRDPDVPNDKQGYRKLLSVRSEPEVVQEVVLRELACVEAALKRAINVADVLSCTDMLSDLVERVSHAKSRIRQQSNSIGA